MEQIIYIMSQFSQDYVIFPLLIIGILFVDRNLFLRIAVLLLIGICINVLLKNMIKIPLNPQLHKDWYAFPSGHTQLTTTFYGYIAYTYRNALLSVLAGIIITGTCVSLIYFGYHDLKDVIGGLVTAVLWMAIFEGLRKSILFRDRFYLMALVFLPIVFIMAHYSAKMPAVHMMVLGSYAGVSLGLLVCHFSSNRMPSKLMEILICVGGAALFFFGMKFLLGMSILGAVGLSHQVGLLLLYGLPVWWITCGPSLMACRGR